MLKKYRKVSTVDELVTLNLGLTINNAYKYAKYLPTYNKKTHQLIIKLFNSLIDGFNFLKFEEHFWNPDHPDFEDKPFTVISKLIINLFDKANEYINKIPETGFSGIDIPINLIAKTISSIFTTIRDILDTINNTEQFLQSFIMGVFNGIFDLIIGLLWLVKLPSEAYIEMLSYSKKQSDEQDYHNYSMQMLSNMIDQISVEELIEHQKKAIKDWPEKAANYNAGEWGYHSGYFIFNVLEFFVPITKLAKLKYGSKTIDIFANASKKVQTPIPTQGITKYDQLKEVNKALGEGTKKKADDALDVAKKEADDAAEKARKLKLDKAKKMWENYKYKDLFPPPTPPKKPCFLAGTLVKTEKGLIEIEKIEKGTKVLSYNFDTQNTEYQPVLQTFSNFAEKYVVIHTDTEVLKVTGAHLFYVPNENKWLAASQLKVDMHLVDDNQNLVLIKKLDIIKAEVPTYNLEVAENHNYFVGEHQHILTHNDGKKLKFSSEILYDFEFYEYLDYNNKPTYVGQTTQKLDTRANQHRLEFEKTPAKKEFIGKSKKLPQEIIINGKPGPFKMTPFEAAVTEMYELNARGGKRIKNKGLFNKKNPVAKDTFKRIKKDFPDFNPCRFYV